jgi:hypothetical protein
MGGYCTNNENKEKKFFSVALNPYVSTLYNYFEIYFVLRLCTLNADAIIGA